MDDRLVSLEVFERVGEALVAASELRAYGIFAHVEGPTAALPRWRSTPTGGVRVKVRAGDYERAKAILEDVSLPDARRPATVRAPIAGLLLCCAAMVGLIVRTRLGGANESLVGVFVLLSFAYLVLFCETVRKRRPWWALPTLPIPVVFALEFLAI